MTLSGTTFSVQYDGDDSTASFSVTFVFWDADDLEVTLTDSNGDDTTWTRGTQYTITGGDGSTGTLTVNTSPTDYTPASGERLTIKSSLTLTQGTDIPTAGDLPSGPIEEQLDKIVRMVQQVAAGTPQGRKLLYAPAGEDDDVSMELPTVDDRGSKYLSFNSSGVPIATSGTAVSPVSSAMEPVVGATTLTAALDLLFASAYQFPSILGLESSTLTLSSGAATGTQSRHVIAAESGTSDDLDTLTATNYTAGDIVFLRADAGDTIYVTVAGNFAQPVMLDDTTWVPFMWDATNTKWELLLSGLIPLDVQTASASSSLDFTKGFATANGYDVIEFHAIDIVPATDNANFSMRTSTDGGGSYDAGTGYHYADLRFEALQSLAEDDSGSDSALLLAAGVGSAAGEAVSGTIRLFKPSSTTYTRVSYHLTYVTDSGLLTLSVGAGARASNEDVDAVRFIFGTGNITSGTIRMYGAKR